MSASDPVAEYLEAWKRYKETTDAGLELCRSVCLVADHLDAWQECLKNKRRPECHYVNEIPPECAEAWPDFETIRDVYQAWGRARRDVLAKWEAIPQDRRHGLKPPPGEEDEDDE